ncbi:MAG TPA: amidohydrolase family protein, partial [Anaerolineales bacterium]|nr:amidohydrolase family protein [Anaerolineales bacterium]
RRGIMQALRAVAQTMGPIPGGATILGAYLEGPYLNPAKRGAHNPSYLRQPDLSAVARWSHTRGVRRRHLLRHASLQRHATSGAPRSRPRWRAAHRSASPVGVIPDGIHLHPSVVKLIWQAKGAAGVNVVTDAMAALGMPPGKYELGGIEVAVDETSARLSDGRLAGSILSLDQAVCNLVGFTGCSLSEAVSTVTTVPAKVLGLTDRGRIAPGCIADLVLLTPELKVVKTIVNGKVALE